MIMNNINTDLFWINTIGNKLQKHTEALNIFCSAILYRLYDFGDDIEKAFKNSLVKKALFNLTLSVMAMNPEYKKKDVAVIIRTVLANYVDEYSEFEKYLLTKIPKVNSTQVLAYNIATDKKEDDLNDKETRQHISKELQKIEKIIG